MLTGAVVGVRELKELTEPGDVVKGVFIDGKRRERGSNTERRARPLPQPVTTVFGLFPQTHLIYIYMT